MELFQYDPHDASGVSVLGEKVGGWIEAAPAIDPTITMYCNEEGKILGLPMNSFATPLLGTRNPDWIAGDVVIVGAADREGYDTELPDRYKKGL